MYDIKSIETEYNGIKFRSRLEARWAVFFDQMGIKWYYEFEGYQTPYEFYVPDFWLPEVYMRTTRVKGVLFEAKPDTFADDIHKPLEFVAHALGVGAILAKGFNPEESFIEIAPGWDIPMAIIKCEWKPCGMTRFDFVHYIYDECEKCKTPNHSGDTFVSDRIKIATDYRFW